MPRGEAMETVERDGAAGNGAAALPDRDAEFIQSMATLFIDVLKPFGAAMARHIHAEVRPLPDDEDAIEATRASCESNMREIFSMLRAGLPADASGAPV